MRQPKISVSNLFDALAAEIKAQLATEHPGDLASSWGAPDEETTSSDLVWRSWTLSIGADNRILGGATIEAWNTLCGLSPDNFTSDLQEEDLSRLTAAIEEIARGRFGAEVTCSLPEHGDAPPPEWAAAVLTIEQEPDLKLSIEFSVDPSLEEALGDSSGGAETAEDADPLSESKVVMNSPDILMHVEMPVSISLGRTKMRMKDLLHLTNGSVVELDQEYGDEVEIRVNNTIIAFGEVVAVDGNYAVRVLRMAPLQPAADLSTASPEKAA